ncbi:MAG: VWA domain-containing protein [Holophagales bacterium]|nr:VWA domain-containing protein [Holophagales bacterium]MYF96786.1 VWA domain-containing protein [Holophagales bacterium]
MRALPSLRVGVAAAAILAQAPALSAQDAIRIIPPDREHRERLSGRVEVQTLIIHPSITAVEFSLDGDRVQRVTEKPFTTHIELADPPREQALEVRGFDDQGNHLGSDRIVLNRLDVPFAVRILEIRREQASEYATARVEAAVSVPRSATLERVEFYRGERLVEALRNFGEETATGAPRTIAVESLMEWVPADGFVRVVARLADGREWEDAELLQGAEHRGEIDVQLVQLQVLVTDRNGNPASNLRPEDFQVREKGERRPVEGLHQSTDVPLVLGLAIDSSSSTRLIRGSLIEVSASFLEAALATSDRAFLVHFNDAVAVLQPPSGHKELLTSRLHYLDPKGGTALNDAILFSLLQYRDEPGRRALVVISDGLDEHSRSEPNQAADFAKRLGVPVYFIQLEPLQAWVLVSRSNRSRDRSYSTTARLREHRRARQRLLRISEQTGGRLLPVGRSTGSLPWPEQLATVFRRIQDDLRHQYVLTYYSDQPTGTAIVPEVRVTRRGLKLRSAVPLEAIE